MTQLDSATRTLISPARLNRPGNRRIYWTLVVLVVIAFTAVFVGPLYWMVTGALKSGQEVAQVPPTLYPKHAEAGNYSDAWTALSLGRLLWRTVYYAVGALAFQLILDVAAAFAFSKLRPV